MKALALTALITLGLAGQATANVFPYLVFPDAEITIDTDRKVVKTPTADE